MYFDAVSEVPGPFRADDIFHRLFDATTPLGNLDLLSVPCPPEFPPADPAIMTDFRTIVYPENRLTQNVFFAGECRWKGPNMKLTTPSRPRRGDRRPAERALCVALAGFLFVWLGGCSCCSTTENLRRDNEPAPRVVRSLRGQPLPPVTIDPETQVDLAENLTQARRDYDANPDDERAAIWLGRRLAYLGYYHEAIDVFSEAIEKHPNSYFLLRHRGHRYITTRQFDRAIDDFSRAAELAWEQPDEIEPDGAPNKYNIPTSTIQTNIWYHFGLTCYLIGDYTAATVAFHQCMQRCRNDDMLVATLYWLYLSAKRDGDDDMAAFALHSTSANLNILENEDYYSLLKLYKGQLAESQLMNQSDDATDLSNTTVAYGVAMHHYFRGETDTAYQMFEDILATGFWPAFGYIAAEAEIAHRDAPESIGKARMSPTIDELIEELN